MGRTHCQCLPAGCRNRNQRHNQHKRCRPYLPAAQVRDSAVSMLDAWIGVASGDMLFPAVAEAVAKPKCIADGKIAGLNW